MVTAALTPVTPAGMSSVISTPRASEGPALLAVRIQETVRPGTAASPAVNTFVNDTSAALPTELVLVAELLSGNGSAVVLVLVAELVRSPTKAGSTVPVIVTSAIPPPDSAPSAQVTCRPRSSTARRGRPR